MAAIRHINIAKFRGFDDFDLSIGPNAVIVGEPGAGRSDLIEALIRVLDPESLRRRYGSDLDIHGLEPDGVATVEVVIGQLSDEASAAFFNHLELWDCDADALVTALPRGDAPDTERHEWVVRLGYRLAIEDGQPAETVFYPKSADPAAGVFPRVATAERSLIPFFWQRGITVRPLDLSGRGELRSLVDRQDGEAFDAAVDRFVSEVSTSAQSFSSHDRVSSALEAVLEPIRSSRRFDEARPASELVRFLPDGGARSGLLRSLAAAITLVDSPPHFPASRQGSTVQAALRAGVLSAVAISEKGAILAVDDFGGEFDPHLARHLIGGLRRASGQLIVATHSATTASCFNPDEVVRLRRLDGVRDAVRGRQPRSRVDRVSQRYLSGILVDSLNASAVIIVEGHHDRMALSALIERAVASGKLASMDGAGITIVEAEGSGESAKVARAANGIGIFAVALLDNDGDLDAASDDDLQACLAAADAVVRLPPRTAIERLLLAGADDGTVRRVLAELDDVFGDLALPPDWSTRSGTRLQRVAIDTLHKRTGSLHGAYVWALEEDELPSGAIEVLEELREVAVTRRSGLTEL